MNPGVSSSPHPGAVQHDKLAAPIGIFDSGIGGLSVLRYIRALLPAEHLLYFADSAHIPYGDKPDSFIIERARAITTFFLARGAKAVVVPCNTATAAAIKALREAHPELPIVGVEPGLKPGAAASKSGTVGVLATAGTLASAKFQALHERISADTGARFALQACPGLADRIERGELCDAETQKMIERYVAAPLAEGADVLVLGCTHYPFVRETIEAVAARLAPGPVAIIDTGEAVARQLARVLRERGLACGGAEPGRLEAFASGDAAKLRDAFAALLHLHPPVTPVATQAAGAAAP